VNWLQKCNKDLFQYLAGQNDNAIYENELIKVLLLEQDYTWQIFRRVLIPYFIYMLSTLTYFTYNVTGVQGPPDQGFFVGEPGNIVLRSIILVVTVALLGLEFMQMRIYGRSYFSEKWNWLQLFLYCSNLAIVIIHVHFEHDPLALSQFTSFMSALNWGMIFYWMRLFTETSFYVLMFKETFYDIIPFLVMYLIAMTLLANAFLILDLSAHVIA